MFACKSMPVLKKFSMRERFLVIGALGVTTKAARILIFSVAVIAFGAGLLIAKFYPIDALSDLGPLALIVPTWIIMMFLGLIANLILVHKIFPQRLASLDIDLETATFEELIVALRK